MRPGYVQVCTMPGIYCCCCGSVLCLLCRLIFVIWLVVPFVSCCCCCGCNAANKSERVFVVVVLVATLCEQRLRLLALCVCVYMYLYLYLYLTDIQSSSPSKRSSNVFYCTQESRYFLISDFSLQRFLSQFLWVGILFYFFIFLFIVGTRRTCLSLVLAAAVGVVVLGPAWLVASASSSRQPPPPTTTTTTTTAQGRIPWGWRSHSIILSYLNCSVLGFMYSMWSFIRICHSPRELYNNSRVYWRSWHHSYIRIICQLFPWHPRMLLIVLVKFNCFFILDFLRLGVQSVSSTHPTLWCRQ